MGKIKKTMSIIAGTTLLVGTAGCYSTMPISQTGGGEPSEQRPPIGQTMTGPGPQKPSTNKNDNNNQRPPLPPDQNNNGNNNNQRPPLPPDQNNNGNNNNQRPPIGQTMTGPGPQKPSNDKNNNNTRPGTRSDSDVTLSDLQLGGSNKVSVTRPVTIYKTTKDYSQNVPVIMNADRTEIVSYPDPKDIRESSKPTQLNNGYLLDNRGIGENVAFLSYTYDEYSKLETAPSREKLMNSIIDKNPLSTIVNCGHASDYSGNLVDALNEYIKNNKLK